MSASLRSPARAVRPHAPVRAHVPRRGRRPARLVVGLLAALCLVLQAAPGASAQNVVNYTFHNPAFVMENPCFPADVVNLNGDIHIVITTTAAASGGYRVNNHLNSLLKGSSITTGTGYVNSEDQNDEWYARAPFPAIHTHTYDFNLISQSGVDDYVLHMTMHETVNANGVPTATVDDYRTDCKG
jgi:hypothetical protein